MTVAFLGCDGLAYDMFRTELAGPPTPGGQTPYPAPNDAGLGYYEYLPAGYGDGTRFPLIVFLHGVGERGNGSLQDLPRVLKNGPPKLIEGGQDFPAIVISPQVPTSQQHWAAAVTTPFVRYLLTHYDVDLERVYITGLSLGGEGTWIYAKSNPTIPAAIVPICGPKFGTGYDALSGLPIWVFHRVGDPTVSINHSVNLLEEVTAVTPAPVVAGSTGYFGGTSWTWRTGQAAPLAGENPTFTVYTGSGHDAWTAAYNNQAMWSWLFAQRRSNGSGVIVLQQDFQGSGSISSYVDAGAPDTGQFNDLSSEATGGTWSVDQGRLRLVRAGSSTADNDAGITRWTDLAGPPMVLHATFDLGVSDWTVSPFQSGAMVLSVGKLTGFNDYGNSEVSANTFHTISVKGEGTGQLTIMTSGIKSALLAANGTMHHVELFLNKSGAGASYHASDGSLRSLQSNGVALWVDGAAVVVDGAAANGGSSTLSDLRIRWPTADNGTWMLDNLVLARAFPQ